MLTIVSAADQLSAAVRPPNVAVAEIAGGVSPCLLSFRLHFVIVAILLVGEWRVGVGCEERSAPAATEKGICRRVVVRSSSRLASGAS